MSSEKEKRRSYRCRHGNLSVTVKRTGFRGRFAKPRVVDWIDYNHRGIAFESSEKYRLAGTLLLDLSISDEKEISISNVIACVRNIKKRTGRYRYGIEFDYHANDYMNSDHVKNSLMDIEQLLKDIFQRIVLDKSHRF